MSKQVKRLIIASVSIMILVIVAAVLLPGLAYDHRGVQRPSCINNLRQINGAKQQWANEYHKTTNDTPTWKDLRDYLKSSPWQCPN